jgi:hypothetical protein
MGLTLAIFTILFCLMERAAQLHRIIIIWTSSLLELLPL